jgi:hypothetical protein
LDPSTPRWLSAAALAGLSGHLVLLTALHFLPTDTVATVNFVSEYALGQFSWVFVAAQFLNLVGSVCLFGSLILAAIAPIKSFSSGLLIVYIVCILLGMVFPVDPIAKAFANGDTPDFTTAGWIHALAGVVGAIAVMIAMILVTIRLARSGCLVAGYRMLLLFCVWTPVAYLAMFITQPATYPAGLYQRLFIIGKLGWLVTVAIGLLDGQFGNRSRAMRDS